MPSRSSIRGRDGLYYRIPDFDELDGDDNFNAQDLGSNMADDLQLSDLDPSIRLLPSGTTMGRGGNDEDSYRAQTFDGMGGMSTSVMPVNDENRDAISATPLARRFENDAYYTSAPDAYGNAITAAEKNRRSTRSASSDSSGSGWAAPQTSSGRLADYAAQTYGRAAGCSTIDECKRLSDQLRTHADTYGSAYAALKDSDQKAAADEYLRMATIATRAAGLTESRGTYLARPPKSVVPSVIDPDTYQGSSYGGPRGYPVLDGFRQYRDGVTGAGVAYISPAAISPWSSPLIQDDLGTKDYLADLDYRTWRFLATGGAQLASDGILSAAFNTVPRAAAYATRARTAIPDHIVPGRTGVADAKYHALPEITPQSLSRSEAVRDIMLPESELHSEGLFKVRHPYALDSLPPDWTSRLNDIRMFPSQNNAEGMAQQAVKEAQKVTKSKANTGMAAAFIDKEGKVTLGYSKYARKDLELPSVENALVQDLVNKNNLNPYTAGYRGVCAEPQVFSQILNNNEQPWGFMGAAQLHDPTGNIRAACRNCGSVNRYFGVGYRDEDFGVVPPKK